MKEIFLYKDIAPLGEKDLVIHIRSGDIFNAGGEHGAYLTPPFSYYAHIIEKNHYETIYLIAEDTKNPCIRKLLEAYPNIKFTIQTLEKDVQIVLAAVNIVMSIGTFLPELLYLSNNIRTIYHPSYFKYSNPDCITHSIELGEYYKAMFPWKNAPAQNEYMLTYTLPDQTKVEEKI
jgi:hypothetical protein